MVIKLISEFEKNSNEFNAKAMQAYMKNKFEFYGIMTTKRRDILKQIIKSNPINDFDEVIFSALELWQSKYRECHYCAIELLEHYKKKMDEGFIIIIEKLIVENSWWDTVDSINSRLVDSYFKKFPHKIITVTEMWNNSNNIWMNRLSVIYQLKWKSKVNTEILSKHILNLLGTKEFFIQKAIGWALREYSKTNPNWVIDFVERHKLPQLSKKEALRLIISKK